MPRSASGFRSLPAVCLLVACATSVQQALNEEPGETGGSQGGATSGTGAGGKAGATGGKSSGSAGTAVNAFGGAVSSGATGGDTALAGSGGSTGPAEGGASGGGPTEGDAGEPPTGSGGEGGTGSSTPSTGECAPDDSGWVVQYWTDTPAANMPAGNVRIFNNSTSTVNFSDLELRHYFTNEETATLSFKFSGFGHSFPADPYYVDEGSANVLGSLQTLTPALATASHYLSVEFNATPGAFGPSEWAVFGYYGSLSMFPQKSNQANDYSYVGHATADPGSANEDVGWDHVTLYNDGELVWGCEP